jgi:hypothetical protein
LISVIAAVFVVPVASSIANAQDDPGFLIIPVEHYACKYNEGQGPADLDKAVATWSKFMDDKGIDNYAAWTLTPHYFGSEQDFDFLWMGAWKDGNAMGSGTDMWLSTGGEHAARFAKVAKCNVHVNSASINYKLPPGGQAPETGVITYSNCHMKHGVAYDAVAMATGQWAKVLTDAGSPTAIYHQFPVFGPGGEDAPDFLWMEAYNNHTDLGADYERMGNGRLYMKQGQLLDHLVDCDTPRVYNAKNRRFVKLR